MLTGAAQPQHDILGEIRCGWEERPRQGSCKAHARAAPVVHACPVHAPTVTPLRPARAHRRPCPHAPPRPSGLHALTCCTLSTTATGTVPRAAHAVCHHPSSCLVAPPSVRPPACAPPPRPQDAMSHRRSCTSPPPRPAPPSGLRALIYSGDHDYAVPHTGSEAWTSELGFPVERPWRPWFVADHQVGTDFAVLRGERWLHGG